MLMSWFFYKHNIKSDLGFVVILKEFNDWIDPETFLNAVHDISLDKSVLYQWALGWVEFL